MPATARSLAPAAVPTGAGFDVVLLLHVATAVVALGSVVVCGVQAGRVLAAGEGDLPGGVAVYFAPGVNWVGRTLHAVPLLGLALVGLSHGAYGFGDEWIQWGIGLWAAAAVGAEAVLWPAERRIQAALAASGPAASGSGPGPGSVAGAGSAVQAPVRRACRTTVLTAGALTAVLVAAIVIMVAQP